MVELSAFLSAVDLSAAVAGVNQVFLAGADITTAVTTNIKGPMLNMLGAVIPVCVGLYVLYKVLGGHTEHAKMLVAEGVVIAAVLEGVLALAKGLS